MRKGTYFLMTVLLLFSWQLKAQEKQQLKMTKALEWTFEEKFKLTPEQVLNLDAGKDNPKVQKALNNLKSTMGEDILVSGAAESESELHAAINPTDSNNIVVSPISMDQTNGIYCPIYYTHDFGQTWNVSDYRNMPYEDGKVSGGGGDPVFAFDADGKLYFTWIDLYGDQSAALFGTMNMGIFWSYSEDGGATWNKPARDTVLLGEMQMMMGQPSSINAPISDKQWMAVDRTQGQYRNNLYICYVTIGQNGQESFYEIRMKTKPAGEEYFTHEANVSTSAEFPFVQFSSLDVDNQGNIHVIFYGTQDNSTYGIWHAMSSDGGQTFSTPNLISPIRFNLSMTQQTPVDEITGITERRTYPSPYMASDQNSGNLYVTWTAFGIDSDLGNGADVYFSRSTDYGTTWSTPQRVNNDPTGVVIDNFYSAIYVDATGRVVLSWYDRRDDPNNEKAHYYVTESTDGGLTFGENYPASSVQTDFTTIGAMNQDFGVGEYNQVLATPSGYNTIPVWADGRTGDGNLDIYIAFVNPETVGNPEIRAVNPNFSLKDIYPNPVKDFANLEFELKKQTEIELAIIDITGKVVKKTSPGNYKAGSHKMQINISDVASGKYLLHVKTKFGNTSKHIVIQK